jgi:hypothetical protein
LAGYVLFAGSGSETGEKARFTINNPVFFLVLGICCIVIGVLKLLSPTLDGIIILGDLIPSAAGVIAGLILIFGIYRQDVSAKSGELDRLGTNMLSFRKPIGLGLMVVALLHFLFPQALFL